MSQEGFKRKLTAILSADVEGYSRLMGDDEEAAARTLITLGQLRSLCWLLLWGSGSSTGVVQQ
jgi:hypothetical protein